MVSYIVFFYGQESQCPFFEFFSICYIDRCLRPFKPYKPDCLFSGKHLKFVCGPKLLVQSLDLVMSGPGLDIFRLFSVAVDLIYGPIYIYIYIYIYLPQSN